MTVVAIDGPAASGKSSTANEVARRIGFLHVDSGALYRALTLVALDLGDDATAERIIRAAELRDVRLRVEGPRLWVLLEGGDAEPRIRSPEVTARVSPVSAMPAVREWVNKRLRDLAANGGSLVLDGRDIGTAVFPDAAIKVYLDASPETRAKRRLEQHGRRVDPETLAAETARIAARDQADSTRAVAPLKAADDAIHIDSGGLTFEEQVGQIVDLVRRGT
ncbi:MAG TPA: (d)CMP kinase [Gemmatimonadales bacterium]|nr:(d)CMP kinase [Gemmatimonadales bacterium]